MSKVRKDASGTLPPSTVVEIPKMVQYADGAIVSRTLVQGKAGTVTLFAFDGGQGLSEHSAPFDALIQVLDGTAEVIIGGTAHLTAAGNSILMPADIPHAVNAPERFKMLLTMIRG